MRTVNIFIRHTQERLATFVKKTFLTLEETYK